MSFDEYAFESYGSNKIVNNLTRFLVDKINVNFGKLILNKELVLKDSLKDFKDIQFIDDTINLKISNRTYGNMNPDCVIKNEDNKNIKGLIINLELVVSDDELFYKKLSKQNPILDTIHHEFLHIVELYLTKQTHKEVSKSFEYGRSLNNLKSKYKDYAEWQNIWYFIYLSLPHEIRARVSATYEEIERSKPEDVLNFIKNSKNYKDADFLSNINVDIVIRKLKTDIQYNDLMLDFNKIFLKNNKKDIESCESEFIKYIKVLKNKNVKLKSKLLKASYNFFENFKDFYTDHPNIDINYSDYL